MKRFSAQGVFVNNRMLRSVLCATVFCVCLGLAPRVMADEANPLQDRATEFKASGIQECRDTVPGGNLLVIAYAVVLGLLGVYVALLARKNSQLMTSLRDLEDELERRKPQTDTDTAGNTP